jgi:hypothetical protein
MWVQKMPASSTLIVLQRSTTEDRDEALLVSPQQSRTPEASAHMPYFLVINYKGYETLRQKEENRLKNT